MTSSESRNASTASPELGGRLRQPHRMPILFLLAIILFAAAETGPETSRDQQQAYLLTHEIVPPAGGGLAFAPNGAALNASIGQPLVGVAHASSGAQLNQGAHFVILASVFTITAQVLRDFLLGLLTLNPAQLALLDVNGDGKIDMADHTQLLKLDKAPAPE